MIDFDKLILRSNHFFQQWRARLLLPFLKVLSRLSLAPGIITNLRLLLAALFFLTFKPYLFFSLLLLTLSLLLDLLDGPLARYQHRSSDRGKFLDMLVDSITYSFVILTFLYQGISPFLVAGNLIALNYTYLLAIIKKNEHKPSDWLIHPAAYSAHLKFLPFAAFYLYHLLQQDYLSLSLYISTALALASAVYYYLALQLRWRKIKNPKPRKAYKY